MRQLLVIRLSQTVRLCWLLYRSPAVRFHTAPLAIAMAQYAKTGDLSLKDAVDSEGVDLVAQYNLNEKAKKDGKDGKGGKDGKDGNSSTS